METIFNKLIDEEVKKNQNKCKIITVEGIDGSGKTTTVNLCVDKLREKGYRCEHFYTSSNYNIYWNTVETLQTKGLIDISTNQILHNLAFITYLRTEFINLLNNNDFVISEWYIYGKLLLSELYDDSYKSKSIITSYMDDGKIIMPNYSFYLSLPIEVAYKRIIKRNGRIESKESLIMLKKATELWKKYIDKYNIEKINITMTPNEISDIIIKRLKI